MSVSLIFRLLFLVILGFSTSSYVQAANPKKGFKICELSFEDQEGDSDRSKARDLIQGFAEKRTRDLLFWRGPGLEDFGSGQGVGVRIELFSHDQKLSRYDYKASRAFEAGGQASFIPGRIAGILRDFEVSGSHRPVRAVKTFKGTKQILGALKHFNSQAGDNDVRDQIRFVQSLLGAHGGVLHYQRVDRVGTYGLISANHHNKLFDLVFWLHPDQEPVAVFVRRYKDSLKPYETFFKELTDYQING